MLIVFEGINKSGTSTLSLQFVQYLNKLFRGKDGLLKLDPHFGDFIWTKEPSFTSEESELLNKPSYVDEFKREKIFFESRIRHQKIIAGKNTVCDRYIWTGMAYTYKYSPNCFRFAKELYLSENLFIQPDLYVFVDTPPGVCYERDTSLDLDTLRELREAFIKTKEYVRVPTITIPSVDGEDQALARLIQEFVDYATKNNLT
jgi:thymidylate kinase